jgi:hypothetical protein
MASLEKRRMGKAEIKWRHVLAGETEGMEMFTADKDDEGNEVFYTECPT